MNRRSGQNDIQNVQAWLRICGAMAMLTNRKEARAGGIIMKAKKYYQEYVPGQPVQSFFDEDRIPLMQMQHLRDMDFPITRNISYERTVDEFLLQLAVNDVLLPLRNRQNIAVLLDRQGALIREDGKWSLLFSPEQGEQLTLAEKDPMYPVLKELLEKEKKKEVSRIPVPDRNMIQLVSGSFPFCILDEYCRNRKGGYMAEAEKLVIFGPEDLYRHVPVCRYGKLATVDKDEVENYQTIRHLLEEYTGRYDAMQKNETLRPLSIAVFGPPGSGKSFGVKQLAQSTGRFSLTSLNVSQYTSPAEMFEALEEAVLCDESNIPLVFFDEFDAELNGVQRGWLKYFLAPMQDGEYSANGKTRNIQAAVFVFAGGTASSFREFLPKDDTDAETFRSVKGPDFVSRLEGILNIKGVNPASPRDRSHMIRRAMLLRDQILQKDSGIYDKESGLINISRSMLWALLSVSEYRHGARSLEFIQEMSRLSSVRRFTASCLPVDEQLDIHLDVYDFKKRLAFEQMMGENVEKYAMIAHACTCRKRLEEAEKLLSDEQEIDQLKNEPDMADWADLPESMRRIYRSQIRTIGVELQDYHSEIGLRPILPGSADTIEELYGPPLEKLAEIEYERILREQQFGGQIQLPDQDAAPADAVPYGDLDESIKDRIRITVRNIPGNLREIGFELYRKTI